MDCAARTATASHVQAADLQLLSLRKIDNSRSVRTSSRLCPEPVPNDHGSSRERADSARENADKAGLGPEEDDEGGTATKRGQNWPPTASMAKKRATNEAGGCVCGSSSSLFTS